MAYVGRGINNISNASILDAITFTNSAGPYNLTQNSGADAFTPISVQALVISVDGVIQDPSSYTISAATITFGVSMASSLTNDFIVHNGVGLITEPSDGSVSTAKIEDLAVTAGKLATDAVETAKIKDLNVTAGKLAATQNLSTKTITLPASVSGLGTGITNAQLAGSIDVTTKITGVVPTANLGSGSASSTTILYGDQTYKIEPAEYDDDAVVNDIATLALHQATNANAAKYSLVNTNVDQFEDSTGVTTFTDCSRDSSGEYVSTVSTGAFTSDSDTLLLLHGDGSDASTTITDSSSNAYACTAVGNAQIDTAQKKYGTGSILFDATGDYVQIADAAWDSVFGTNPWTFELWARFAAVTGSNQTFISKGGYGAVTGDVEGYSWKYNAGAQPSEVSFTHLDATPTLDVNPTSNTKTFVVDTWYHFSLVRESDGQYYFYVDGVSQGTLSGDNPDTAAIDSTSASDLRIGASWDASSSVGLFFNGHIDELRISDSVRYPSGTTFTPNQSATATGNFISTASTANAAVTSMGIVMTYTNASGTATLNTDIVAEVSADGGSNYTTVVLTAGGTFSTGILQAIANDVSVTSGTSIQYRISFANQSVGSKITRINGVSLMY